VNAVRESVVSLSRAAMELGKRRVAKAERPVELPKILEDLCAIPVGGRTLRLRAGRYANLPLATTLPFGSLALVVGAGGFSDRGEIAADTATLLESWDTALPGLYSAFSELSLVQIAMRERLDPIGRAEATRELPGNGTNVFLVVAGGTGKAAGSRYLHALAQSYENAFAAAVTRGARAVAFPVLPAVSSGSYVLDESVHVDVGVEALLGSLRGHPNVESVDVVAESAGEIAAFCRACQVKTGVVLSNLPSICVHA
jgi:O-acetyl-ADP-ribose deacetylase (regulator of RNase III)